MSGLDVSISQRSQSQAGGRVAEPLWEGCLQTSSGAVGSGLDTDLKKKGLHQRASISPEQHRQQRSGQGARPLLRGVPGGRLGRCGPLRLQRSGLMGRGQKQPRRRALATRTEPAPLPEQLQTLQERRGAMQTHGQTR